MSESGSGEAEKITGATEWTLDMSTDTVEVTAFGDANKSYVQGLKDVKGSVAGFVIEDQDQWFKAAASATAVKMYLYWSSQMTGKYAYGTAWFSISLSNQVSGANGITGNFIAAGPWAIVGF
jgi:nitrous oxide reductase